MAFIWFWTQPSQFALNGHITENIAYENIKFIETNETHKQALVSFWFFFIRLKLNTLRLKFLDVNFNKRSLWKLLDWIIRFDFFSFWPFLFVSIVDKLFDKIIDKSLFKIFVGLIFKAFFNFFLSQLQLECLLKRLIISGQRMPKNQQLL